IAPRAASSVSTNRQKAAPLDSASKPNAPEPANRSITRLPRTPSDQGACSRMLKIACRARSDVGRVASPTGDASVFPRNSPDTMRTQSRLDDRLVEHQGPGVTHRRRTERQEPVVEALEVEGLALAPPRFGPEFVVLGDADEVGRQLGRGELRPHPLSGRLPLLLEGGDGEELHHLGLVGP